MGKAKSGGNGKRAVCSLCAGSGFVLKPAGGVAEKLWRRVEVIEARLTSQEERMVEWRSRQARAIGGLLDRVVEVEKRGETTYRERGDSELRRELKEWIAKHVRGDFDVVGDFLFQRWFWAGRYQEGGDGE